MVKLFGVDPPADTFSEHYDSVLAIAENYWTQLLLMRIDVILDFGFWNRSYRDDTRNKVKECGGIPKLLSFSIPEDIAQKRCEKRNQHLRGDFLICNETFDVLKKRFEPLGKDEDYIEIQKTSE